MAYFDIKCHFIYTCIKERFILKKHAHNVTQYGVKLGIQSHDYFSTISHTMKVRIYIFNYLMMFVDGGNGHLV